MFCQNCGTQNADGSLFCENCGAKLDTPVAATPVEETPVVEAAPVEETPVVEATPVVEPTPVAPVQQAAAPAQPAAKKPFKFNILWAVAAVEAVLVIVAAVFLVNSLKVANNFEKTVSTFWNYMAAGNYEKAYEFLDVDEDSILSEESFVSAMASQPYAEAEKVSIKKAKEKSKEASCIVKYEYDDDDYELELELELNGKKGIFGSDWKISAAPFINRDVYVSVPKNAELYIDGKAVSDKYKEDDYTYKVGKVFKGYHSYVAKFGVLSTKEVVTNADSVYCSSLTLADEDAQTLLKFSTEALTSLASALVSGSDYTSTVGKYFTDMQGSSSYYTNESVYSNYSDNFFKGASENWSGRTSGITSMNLSELNALLYSVSSYDGVPTVTVYLTGKLNFKYNTYYATKKLMEEEKLYDNDLSMYVDFQYINGEWIADDLRDYYGILSPSRY